MVVTFFKARLFSRALGREGHCKEISLACAHSDSATLGLPRSWRVCLPHLHCSDSRLLCQELSDAGPGLHAFPRSKPFRFSGTPQRCRLGCACILCPSQVRAAQVTRCLASAVTPSWRGASYRLPRPSRSVFWVYNGHAFSGVPCVSSGDLISGCDPPGGCQPSRNPRSLDSRQSLLAVWYRMPLWGCNCPLLALAALACLSVVGDGLVHSRLALLCPLFCEQDACALG